MRWAIAIGMAAAVMLAAGCGEFDGWKPFSRGDQDRIKPTIAVIKFENRAPFPFGWNIGGGMADVLVDKLVATKRYHVVERPDIDSVIREIKFQQSGATRSQGRTAAGRIKNVQYLVKGVVTDFGHVSTHGGFFSGGGWDIFGTAARAVMGVTVQVIDVESGEVICSQSINESVRAKDLEVKAAYRGVAFGGKSFYRTPLGKATGKVIGKAVRRIGKTIANRPWAPKVAQITPEGQAVINGGRNHKFLVGMEFDVMKPGAPVIDPDTGDMLGRHPGTPLGRVRIFRVERRYSVAEMVNGKAADLHPGQQCQLAIMPE